MRRVRLLQLPCDARGRWFESTLATVGGQVAQLEERVEKSPCSFLSQLFLKSVFFLYSVA